MLIEKVIDKIQDILGDNYKVYDGNTFNSKYVNEVEKDINWQAFDENKGKILVNFIMLPAKYAVASFLSYNTTYSIEFWVPVEFKIGLDGEPLENIVNVWDDYQRLRQEFGSLVNLTEDTIENDVVVKSGITALMDFS